MRKLIDRIFLAGVFIATLQSAWGFSLGGPIGNADDQWQIASIGYGYHDPVAPKDIYEEYRPVVPVMYYACDESFLAYYGTSGLTNVDAAFGILNGVMCGQTNTSVFLFSPTNGVTLAANGQPGGTALTLGANKSLDSYGSDLADFPLESVQWNYTAQTLGLMDMKSIILHATVLQLGLANPDRYVWTLHDRLPNPNQLPNPKCPQDVEYLVVRRNYDINPTQNYPYSSYINDTLYRFYIYEDCGDHSSYPFDARTFPLPEDLLGSRYSAVAGGGLYQGDLGYGAFRTGLTRDDVAGLKYLLSATNINWEAPSAQSQSFTISTNYATTQPFPPVGAATTNGVGFYYFNGSTNGGVGYGSLAPFLAFARTNDQATLLAAYPGVVVSSVNTSWLWASNETYSYSYSLKAGDPVGNTPVLTVKTNYTGYYRAYYTYQFANIFTNHYYTNKAQWVSTTVGPPIGSPYGTPAATNATVVWTNQIGGDFFVLPAFYTGVCPLDIVESNNFNVLVTTNYLTQANTNLVTATNVVGISNSVYLVTYFTNYSFLINPVTCATGSNGPALRRGLGKVQFIRANYDALMGQTFQPLTNYYSMVAINNNSQPVTEYYQRVVTAPDFVFQAQDLTVPTTDFPYGADYTVTTPQFDTSAIKTALAGPGSITPGGVMVFNKNENELYWNGSLANYSLSTNQFLNPDTQMKLGGWGTFDGSTNYPVVYPSTTSIADLMNQIIIQVAPASVPSGTNGVAYNAGAGVTFTASGGQPPYTWAAPGLLVPGLSFNSATAKLSGTPTMAGTYNFTVQVTDSGNRVVNLNYMITIH